MTATPDTPDTPEALAQRVRELAGLATPMALRTAATLRLADRVPAGGATAAELAGLAGADPGAMVRLLDHLVVVGAFTEDGGRYRTTPLGDALRADAGNDVLDELDAAAAIGRAQLSLVALPHTVRTGRAAYPEHYGTDFWSDLAATPSLQESFDAKMTNRFRHMAATLAGGFDWGRFRRVVDVGGGRGTILSAILTEHPGLSGEVVDLAPTAEGARAGFAAAGLADRAAVTVGSFFDPLPTGADAYLLSDILHDWDDEHAARILGNCATAAGPGGRVLVVERIRGAGTDTGFDLAMLAFFGGKERDVDELAALAAPHGLHLVGSTRVLRDRSVVEFAPAAAAGHGAVA